MNFIEILKNSSAGMLVTDAEFKVIWANKFEENFYGRPLNELIGLDVVNCHQEVNKDKIKVFLESFKNGEIKEFTKNAMGMIITYSSYYDKGEFAGIVRTRIKIPG